jgi:methionyl-tRNA synthetase
MPKTTVTAALPYANGPIHIGHLAGVYLPADIYVRFLRTRGREVIFVCGSDEHGVPITIRARNEGVNPQEIVDKYHAIIGKSFSEMGISMDIYSRTSNEIHKQTSQEFFTDLYDKGSFTEVETEQFYDAEAKQFLADRYITGTCPVCSNPGAYGDQCERCGSTLSPDELLEPKSALSGNVPEKRKTKNWYLPLDKLQEDFLNDYIDSVDGTWKSHVIGQCRSWLKEGLKPRAMTRDLDWGVPVPLPGSEGKVLYVWFEAPIGYISATRELRPNDWEEWWKGDAQLVQFIGKDNIVFHCIIFPATLHVRGDGFVVPAVVPANEFLNLEGNKISTSRNWAVWLNEYLEEMPGRQDELRYVLGSIMPETKDAEFTWKDYQTRVNSELVGILGNFLNRVMVLSQKYYGGALPAAMSEGALSGKKAEAIDEILRCREGMINALENFKFREGLGELMNMARAGNKFLADAEPWKLQKSDPEATADALNFGLQVAANLALACEPFLPFTHEKICAQLNFLPLEYLVRDFWSAKSGIELLKPGHTIGEPGLLFAKVEDDVIETQVAKLGPAVPAVAPTEPVAELKTPETKGQIQYDDFAKMDICVAQIKHAEAVPKADKLLKLTLDAGGAERTVLSGIAEHFKPEEIIGKKVLYLANLAPRKMRGVDSEGMILMAEENGKLFFVAPDGDVGPGSRVS